MLRVCSLFQDMCISYLAVRTMSTNPKTGIVLLNMGGPQKLDDVSEYLHKIMTDRDMIQLPFAQDYLGAWIAKRRSPEVQKKYSEIGGGSPILRWTHKQGSLLCKKLDTESPETAPHAYYIAFRYVSPYVNEVFESIAKDGVRNVILFSQYPQYCCSTSGSSFNSVFHYFKNAELPKELKLSVIDRWSQNPLYVKCFAELVKTELDKFAPDIRDQVVLLFSAHSLPLKCVIRGDSYPSEVGTTVNAVMESLKYCNPYQITWQSKVGPLPWLGPFTDESIASYVKQGKKHFLLVPITFVNEHIETLHELDIEICNEFAPKVGVKEIRRVPTPNDNPIFISALADIVCNHLKRKVPVSKKFLLNCSHCVNPNCYESKKWYQRVCSI